MRLTTLSLSPVIMGGVVFAASSPRCGTAPPSAEHIAETKKLMESFSEPSLRTDGFSDCHKIIVPAYFHILALNDTLEGGYISSDIVEEQINVINTGYKPHGIRFDLIETQWYINPDWATSESWPFEEWFPIRQATRKGGYDTLNIWIQPSFGDPEYSPIGWCLLPAPPEEQSDFLVSVDGCSIITSSLPGGEHPEFNMGKTATHEIGHWLNLYHTFEGEGCSEPGDYVDDTPTQEFPGFGCPVGQDSCPDHPGLDPIHNFMDYSDDYCLEEFTPGQGKRMRATWFEWRKK